MDKRVIFILTFFGAGLAQHQQTRIVGGQDTTIGQFPFLASIQFLYAGGIIQLTACGGSLITATTVLTGAYCFYQDGDSPVSLYRVRVGSSQHNAGGTVHTVSRIVSHEDYAPLVGHDIAIVDLAAPAVLSDAVGLATIAGSNYNPPDGAPVVVVGWGFNGAIVAPQLKRADINIVNQNVCADRYDRLNALGDYRYLPNVTSNMVCAGFNNGPCTGDFGSPLLHDNIVVGVSSWHFACADGIYPDVFTRVSMYTDWIRANVNNASDIVL